MFNKLSNGAPLTIHCKSRDDDLGKHVLGAGQSYSFQFRVNIFGSTLFFCGASWQGGQIKFEIYNTDRDDYGRCNEYCQWEARDYAIVGFKEGESKSYDISLPWHH
ncbi:S-protein homolog 2-like [Punica granatum]|nr:S-protein homolog 2-like [Punica granatum]